MAQYQSILTGPEIDAALQDMANHDSEAWAVGTRDGAAVSSLDVTYHNNAKYYSDNAVGAAARAEAAVPAGTSGAVFFDQAQTLTSAQQAQARNNIGAGDQSAKYIDTGQGANYNASAASYSIFARVQKNTIGSVSQATMLVSNVSTVSDYGRGLYYVEIMNRSTGFNLYYTQLAKLSSNTKTITFGYYDGGDGYWYIGVYRSGTYGGAPVCLRLAVGSNRPVELLTADTTPSSFAQTDPPSGWTAGTLNS